MDEPTKRIREICIMALRNYRSDDLERAESAKRHIGPKKSKEDPWGQSGKTLDEIIEEYRQHVVETEQAIAWVKSFA